MVKLKFPYFYIPKSPCPPAYHFVLDTSGSMEGDHLEDLKKSVIKLSEALFNFQPNARIEISEFNSSIRKIGNFGEKDLDALSQATKKLYASGNTHLYEATSEQLSLIRASDNHNNILLFTDGEDCSKYQNWTQGKLNELLEQLKEGPQLTLAKNKFFIISFRVPQQPELMRQIASLFASPVIDSNSADFAEALAYEGKMQKWAAASNLFKCQFLVNNNSKEYCHRFDLCGQFAALEPQSCGGEEIYLTITDGDGNVILDDRKPLKKRSAPSLTTEVALPLAPVASLQPAATPSVKESLMHTLWENKGNIAAASAAALALVTYYNA